MSQAQGTVRHTCRGDAWVTQAPVMHTRWHLHAHACKHPHVHTRLIKHEPRCDMQAALLSDLRCCEAHGSEDLFLYESVCGLRCCEHACTLARMCVVVCTRVCFCVLCVCVCVCVHAHVRARMPAKLTIGKTVEQGVH